MSSSVPAKVAFVKSTLQRAAELQDKQPIIAYFCKLHAVQQVLATKLHQQDPHVKEFAADLLGEIETAKASDVLTTPEAADILQNDDVAQVYTLTFAQNIFERAAKAVDERRATKATAQTFLAAVNFLELQQIWDNVDDEVKQQIKYAKFQAARILKAYKNGEDPNPAPEHKEDAPELGEQAQTDQLSPSAVNEDDRDDSVTDEAETTLPEPPNDSPVTLPSTPANIPDVTLPETPNSQPNDLGLPLTPGADPSVPFDYDAPPKKPDETDFTAPVGPSAGSTAVPKPAPKPASKVSALHAAHAASHPPINMKSVMAEAATTTAAQKHAKYAISALNYDDVDTAVAELNKALAILRNFNSR